MRVALDAGHGYKDGKPTGAQSGGLVEDDLALLIAHKLRWYLIQAGCEVVLTRPDRAFVPLGMRGSLAKARGCDLFVSVHINAAARRDAQGAEILVAEGDSRSALVAGKLLDVLVNCGLRRCGVKWDSQSAHSRLRVLRDTYKRMPAVLLEIGFLTNPGDAALLGDTRWTERVAATLCTAICPQQTSQ